jgi:hypothetical protein
MEVRPDAVDLRDVADHPVGLDPVPLRDAFLAERPPLPDTA